MPTPMFTLMQGEYLKNSAYAKVLAESNSSERHGRSMSLSPTTGCSLYKLKSQNEDIPKYKRKSEYTFIYTAHYLKYDETAQKTRANKIILTFLWLATVLFHAAAMVLITKQNASAWVQIVDSFAVLSTFYLGYTLVVQLTAPENKTIYKYSIGSVRMRSIALISAALYLIGFLILLGFAIFGTSAGLPAMAVQLAAAIFVGAMFIVEQKRSLTVAENDYVIPEGAEPADF